MRGPILAICPGHQTSHLFLPTKERFLRGDQWNESCSEFKNQSFFVKPKVTIFQILLLLHEIVDVDFVKNVFKSSRI